MSRRSEPRRNPLACGALGDYDPALVAGSGGAWRARCPSSTRTASSILLLDRAPIRWRGRGRGSPGARAAPRAQRAAPGRTRPWSSPRAGSWRTASDAACTRASRAWPRLLRRARGAVYFASRIDPLVRPCHAPDTIDWRAWASIFYLRFPLGERTPFREVKRLRPFSTLEWDAGGERRRTVEHRWPWAEVEPDLDLEEGSGAVRGGNAGGDRAARGEDRVLHPERRLGLPPAALPAGRARARRPRAADREPGQRPPPRGGARGGGRRRLGVPHTTLEGDAAAFWDDTRERALRVDFQLAAPPWAMPLAAALRGRPGVATDGLALDTLAQAGDTYYTESMIRPDGTPAVARELWTSLLGQVMRHATWRVLSRGSSTTS